MNPWLYLLSTICAHSCNFPTPQVMIMKMTGMRITVMSTRFGVNQSTVSLCGASVKSVVDIWERNKELIRKRTDIGEHFTREVIQSIVFIFLPLGERVHLTNRSSTTNPLGNKECLSMWVINREDCNRSLLLTLVRIIYCSIGEANGI